MSSAGEKIFEENPHSRYLLLPPMPAHQHPPSLQRVLWLHTTTLMRRMVKLNTAHWMPSCPCVSPRRGIFLPHHQGTAKKAILVATALLIHLSHVLAFPALTLSAASSLGRVGTTSLVMHNLEHPKIATDITQLIGRTPLLKLNKVRGPLKEPLIYAWFALLPCVAPTDST